MSRNTEIPNDDANRSRRIMDRSGWRVAFSTSIPLARASTRARSFSDTMSWSRSCGDSSRKVKKAMTTTPMHTKPEMMNWSCHGCRCSRVWVATTLAARLPTVGPSAQNPMAAPRPICGEKSRMSAGVETRMIPSTNPMTQ